MKTYTRDELSSIIEKHIKWIRSEECGQRADLRGADLKGADLREAYLLGAYLLGADLREACLREAYLQGADLRDADLKGADLKGAYLQGADLRDADLRDADLQGADLRGADLRGAKTEKTYFEPQSKYYVMHRSDGMVRIGCKEKTIEQWDAWFASDEQYETKRGTDDFKRIHAHYLAVRAYVLHMEGGL